jgi:25S rRNA (adenine2142-N1)-methyltransferase
MPKARKRKQPLSTTETRDESSSSKPEASRRVIRKFHVLLKQQTQVDESNIEQRSKIQRELDEIGGLELYQKMSSIGQGKDRGGGSEKVLISWLKGEKYSAKKLRLLEVGALKPDNYQSCESWLDVTPIDLRSRHPMIKEQDFLEIDVAANTEAWNVISLSLVLNFVSEPKARGQMLQMAHTMLAAGGLLYVVLPQPCVNNSRYLTEAHFQALMDAIGFEQLHKKSRQGGKLSYWLMRKQSHCRTGGVGRDLFSKKSVLLQGSRNNFCILL